MSLFVPCKRGIDVDLKKPLKLFIGSTFGAEQAEILSSELDKLNELRSNSINKLADRSINTISVLSSYYDQLSAIENKITIAENAVRIDFKWTDAFGGRRTKVSSGAFERVAVLFNIGALYSQVASDSFQVCDDSSLRNGAKYFQNAAGIFGHLKDVVPSIPECSSSVDLSIECLNALRTLMLAQAQACIFQKASKDNMKASIVAKIAQQACELFRDSKDLLSSGSVKSICSKEWTTNVTSMIVGFQGLAQYFQGRAAGDAQSFGEQIARYKYAENLVKNAQQMGSTFPRLKEYLERIRNDLKTAERENSVIYHVPVPSQDALTIIDRAVLTKEIVPTFPLTADGDNDPLDRLVPIAVYKSRVVCDKMKQSETKSEVDSLREATDLMNVVLASLNLPACLEDEEESEVPPSILEKAEKVRNSGGVDVLKKGFETNAELLKKCDNHLKESRRLMNEEKAEDDSLRQQYGQPRWCRTPSQVLIAPWLDELATFESILQKARQSDGVLKERYQKHANAMELLSKSNDAIATALPSGSLIPPTDSFNMRQINAKKELLELCQRVQVIQNQRAAMEEELQSLEIPNLDTCLQDFVQTNEGKPEAVEKFMKDKLEIAFKTFRKSKEQSLLEQDSVLSQIQLAYREFNGGQSPLAGANLSRAELLSTLASAFDQFQQLRANQMEGEKFYQTTLTNLEQFQVKIEDFCLARCTEKEDLIDYLRV